MIEEKAGYLKDFPMNIRIAHIENYPLHYHCDVEFIYLLKGFVTLKCGSSIYKMQQGDVFVINESEVHGIYDCSSDNVLLSIQINTNYFSKYYPMLEHSIFRTLSRDRSDENLISLRNNLLHIASNYLRRTAGYRLDDVNIMIDTLDLMYKFFASFYFEGKTVMQKRFENPEQTDRLGRIISYIYEHHSENIALKDLAEMEYLSEYYISHLITKGTGLNFRELLAFARVEESEKILLQSNEKISVIAKQSGFSTTAYYKKFFYKWYMCEPEEYRKLYSNHIKGYDIENTTELELSDATEIITESIKFLSFEIDEQNKGKYYYDEIVIDCDCEGIGRLEKRIEINGVTAMKDSDFQSNPQVKALVNADINFKMEKDDCVKGFYIWDTIAAIPHILLEYLNSPDHKISVNKLIDRGNGGTIISGENGIFTTCKIAKPAYYAYRILNDIRGEILERNDHYIVARNIRCLEGNRVLRQYSVVIFNTNQEIEELFKRKHSMKIAQQAIDNMSDSLDVKITINGIEPGMYKIIEAGQAHNDSLFYMSYMDNNVRMNMNDEDILMIGEASIPKTRITTEFLENDFLTKANIKGLEFRYIKLLRI